MLRIIFTFGPVGIVAALTLIFVERNASVLAAGNQDIVFLGVSALTLGCMIAMAHRGADDAIAKPCALALLVFETFKAWYMPGGLVSAVPYPEGFFYRVAFWLANDMAALLFIALGVAACRVMDRNKVRI